MKFWPFKRRAKAATLKDPDWWEGIGGGKTTAAGKNVTSESSLRVAAVFACARIISETVASLPLHIYRKENGRREQIDHPVAQLLGMGPNPEMTAMDARQSITLNLLMHGTAYSQQIRNGRGQLVEINPLKSKHMKVERSRAGRLVYDYQEPGSARVFQNDQIWRVANIGLDGVCGLSVIGMARETIGTAMAMEEHGGRLFSNGLHTNLWLEYPNAVNDEQFKRLTEYLDERGGVTNTGKPFFAEGGSKLHSIGMNNDDAQFLESRKFSVADIARWFGVPPHMVGDLEKATFSNIEHQAIEFVVHTIRAWLVRFEQSIWRDLLNQQEKRNLYARHIVEGLLRGDTKARYEAYGVGIKDGWMTRNEARELEERNREEGLDDFLLPMNFDQVQERSQRLAGTVGNILAKAELDAIRVEHRRQEADGFNDWLVGFYARHTDRLIENGIGTEAARSYSYRHINLFQEHGADHAIALLEATAHTEVANLL